MSDGRDARLQVFDTAGGALQSRIGLEAELHDEGLRYGSAGLSPGSSWTAFSDPPHSTLSAMDYQPHAGMLAGGGRKCPDENRKILRCFSAGPLTNAARCCDPAHLLQLGHTES
jgi:hypothetical protein